MYAIIFKLDITLLEQLYPSKHWHNAYDDIQKILEPLGFNIYQQNIYFGNADITPVQCVLATQKLASNLSWFAPSVSNMKMLRIEENADLIPAL
jgi:virulence-associated protein VapD